MVSSVLFVVLFLVPVTLLAEFLVRERSAILDEATSQLAQTPLRRWSRQLMAEGDTVLASRVRVGLLLRRAVVVGWVIGVLYVGWSLV